ncbi:lytic polysaccharide monooxygenase [Pseudomonas sp. CM27]|uniref:lytic polysaccharide monooxygenase n=1 Tax=Pseudomonas sp. CM27 TaxID=2738452 RepID=UPI00155603A9|nr:lytic polysaccharide monooxygenase [Pseudomonas sp. CM27]NQD75659.1 chitin-binding protein [Pseudomonas sp. CM27]
MKQYLQTSLACLVAGASLQANAAQPQPQHGAMEVPIARQYACYKAQDYYWPEDGSKIKGDGCRAAYQHVFKKYDSDAVQAAYQFNQWHETSKNVMDYNNMEAVKAAIPDGQLCSAGNAPDKITVTALLTRIKSVLKGGIGVTTLVNDKSGLDQPANWTPYELVKGADNKADFRFKIMAPHNPSFWQFYVSKPGYDPTTQVLKWDDLELVHEEGNVQPVNGHYEMQVDLKENTGRRVIYTRWQREDSAGEGFYNCSDVNIVSGK